MKIVVAYISFLSLVACGSAQTETQKPADQATTASAAQAADANAPVQQISAGTKDPAPQQPTTTAQEPNQVAQEPNAVATPAPTAPADPNAGVAAPIDPNTLRGSSQDGFLNTAADPNILRTDLNPNHLTVDPATGDLDFRYGGFSVGLAPQTEVDECSRTVKGGAFTAPLPDLATQTWSCDGTPCTFLHGVVAWTRSGYAETISPDGTGTITLPDGKVCDLKVTP